MIPITKECSIPAHEIWFTASRSGGPGGQNVNKVSSRMTLHFDVQNSPTLTDDQKRRITSRLSTRLTNDGVLKLHSQRYRSQTANRTDLIERFIELMHEALAPRAVRKRTHVPRSVRERRLQDKKHHGSVKKKRAHPGSEVE